MKLRKEEKERMKVFLESHKRSIGLVYNELEDTLNYKSPIVEEYMKIKKKLMMTMVSFPLSPETCPFCLRHSEECDYCEYGKKHGACDKEGSDYNRIINAKRELLSALEEYFYENINTITVMSPKVADTLRTTMEYVIREKLGAYNRVLEILNTRNTTFHQYMKAKKELLLELATLPLTVGACPYCLIHDLRCDECEYGKIHGKCSMEESKFGVVCFKVTRLTIELRNYYDEGFDYSRGISKPILRAFRYRRMED